MSFAWLRRQAHDSIKICKEEFGDHLDPDKEVYAAGLHDALKEVENKYNSTSDTDSDRDSPSYDKLYDLVDTLTKKILAARKEKRGEGANGFH